VELPLHGVPGGQRSVTDVDDSLPLFPDVQDVHGAQGTGVRCLTATLWIKYSGIQDDAVLSARLLTAEDFGYGAAQMAVFIIKLSGLHKWTSQVCFDIW
jgi:hypothetical protein